MVCEKAYDSMKRHYIKTLPRTFIDSLSSHLFYAAYCLNKTTFEEFAIWCELSDISFIYDKDFMNSLMNAGYEIIKKSSTYLEINQTNDYLEKMSILKNFIQKLNSNQVSYHYE